MQQVQWQTPVGEALEFESPLSQRSAICLMSWFEHQLGKVKKQTKLKKYKSNMSLTIEKNVLKLRSRSNRPTMSAGQLKNTTHKRKGCL